MSAQTVFVNGSAGFNATWEIQNALQKGFDVVVSVRSHSKGAFLTSIFGPMYGDRFGYRLERDSSSSSSESRRSRRRSSDSSSSEYSLPSPTSSSVPMSPTNSSETISYPVILSPASSSGSLPGSPTIQPIDNLGSRLLRGDSTEFTLSSRKERQRRRDAWAGFEDAVSSEVLNGF